MRKHIGLIGLIIALLVFCGCSTSNSGDPNASTENQEENVDNKDAEDSESKKTDLKELDGLSGQELYEAFMAMVKPNAEKLSYQVEMVSKDYTGQEITSISTVVGENHRMDNKTENGVNVYIYNNDEGVSYTYDESTKQGFKMKETEDSYEGDYEEEYNYEEDGSVKSAELGEFLNRKVLIVIFEATEGYEAEMWLDLELGAPLKTIMRENGTTVYEASATKVDAKFKVDKDTFVPPSDIEFVDF